MNSRRSLRRVSVFIASPGDVANARDSVRHTIERVNRLVAKPNGILLEAIGWEDVPAGKGERAQELINPFVDAADIFVGLLGKRFGTPTGLAESGTYEEYQRAATRWKNESPRPDIKIYFRTLNADDLREPSEQLQKVLEFKRDISKTDLYHEFDVGATLERRIEDDLAAWVYSTVKRGTLLRESDFRGISEKDVEVLAAFLTTQPPSGPQEVLERLANRGLLKQVDSAYRLTNSTEGFAAVAKHLNVSAHGRGFLQSAYFSQMVRAHLKHFVQARYHVQLSDEQADVLRQFATLSRSVTAYLLGGDTALYDNLFEHSVRLGNSEYANGMLYQNVVHQALLSYAQDAIDGSLLDAVDGNPLAGQAVGVSVSGVFEGGQTFDASSLVPSVRAKFGGPGVAEKGQMVSGGPALFVHHGTIFLQLRLYDLAVRAFEIALQHDLPVEGRVAALNNLGLAFLNGGKKEEARGRFLEAVGLDPNATAPRENLALLGPPAHLG